MGQAKANRARKVQLTQAIERVSSAIRRLASAASGQFGGDCYTHAKLCQLLLSDLGMATRVVAGYAAWRVGLGDGDVVSHTDQAKAYLPPGAQGLAYHCWLEFEDSLIDFTTYQLPVKAAELDQMDGGTTDVSWSPDYLWLNRSAVQSYSTVAQAYKVGLAYYEAKPELLAILEAADQGSDPQDIAAARLILANPAMNVIGPRTVEGLNQ